MKTVRIAAGWILRWYRSKVGLLSLLIIVAGAYAVVGGPADRWVGLGAMIGALIWLPIKFRTEAIRGESLSKQMHRLHKKEATYRSAVVANVQRDVASLTAQTSTIQSAVGRVDATATDLRAEVAALESPKGAEGRLETVEASQADLRGAIEQIGTDASSLARAVNAQDGRVSSLAQTITEQNDEVASLAQALTAQDGRVSSLDQGVTALEKSLDTHGQKTNHNFSGVAARVTELEGKVETASTLAEESSRQLARRTTEVRLDQRALESRLDAALDVLRATIDSVARDLATPTAAPINPEVVARLSNLETAVTDATRIAADVEAGLASRTQALADLQPQLGELRDAIARVDPQVAENRADLLAMQHRVDSVIELPGQVAELSGSVEQLVNRDAGTGGAVEVDHLRDDVDELRGHGRELAARADMAESHTNETQARLGNLEQAVSGAEQRLGAVEQAQIASEHQVTNLEQAGRAAEQRLGAVEHVAAEAQNRASSSQLAADSLAGRLDANDARVANIGARVDNLDPAGIVRAMLDDRLAVLQEEIRATASQIRAVSADGESAARRLDDELFAVRREADALRADVAAAGTPGEDSSAGVEQAGHAMAAALAAEARVDSFEIQLRQLMDQVQDAGVKLDALESADDSPDQAEVTELIDGALEVLEAKVEINDAAIAALRAALERNGELGFELSRVTQRRIDELGARVAHLFLPERESDNHIVVVGFGGANISPVLEVLRTTDAVFDPSPIAGVPALTPDFEVSLLALDNPRAAELGEHWSSVAAYRAETPKDAGQLWKHAPASTSAVLAVLGDAELNRTQVKALESLTKGGPVWVVADPAQLRSSSTRAADLLGRLGLGDGPSKSRRKKTSDAAGLAEVIPFAKFI